jgi:hypothetical protein
VSIANSKITFAGSVTNLIYISSFFNSSIQVTVNCNTQPMAAYVPPNSYDMIFSSITCSLAPYFPYINSNSLVTVDIYQTYAFSKLGTAASNVVVLPISTMVRYNNVELSSPMMTTFLYAGNTRSYQPSQQTPYIDAYNMYSSPIRLNFPPGTFTPAVSSFIVLHKMPSSIQNAGFQVGLHCNMVIPYFDPANSVFLSVQNIPRA